MQASKAVNHHDCECVAARKHEAGWQKYNCELELLGLCVHHI